MLHFSGNFRIWVQRVQRFRADHRFWPPSRPMLPMLPMRFNFTHLGLTIRWPSEVKHGNVQLGVKKIQNMLDVHSWNRIWLYAKQYIVGVRIPFPTSRHVLEILWSKVSGKMICCWVLDTVSTLWLFVT